MTCEMFHFVCACGAKLDVLAMRCCGCARRSKTGMVLKHALTMGSSLVVAIGLQAKNNWLVDCLDYWWNVATHVLWSNQLCNRKRLRKIWRYIGSCRITKLISWSSQILPCMAFAIQILRNIGRCKVVIRLRVRCIVHLGVGCANLNSR